MKKGGINHQAATGRLIPKNGALRKVAKAIGSTPYKNVMQRARQTRR